MSTKSIVKNVRHVPRVTVTPSRGNCLSLIVSTRPLRITLFVVSAQKAETSEVRQKVTHRLLGQRRLHHASDPHNNSILHSWCIVKKLTNGALMTENRWHTG